MKKQRWEESEKIREEKKPQEDAGAPKDRKVAKNCFFPMTWRRRVEKKAHESSGAEPFGQMRD